MFLSYPPGRFSITPLPKKLNVLFVRIISRENKDKVETYLSFGASRFEACKPIATEALRLALLPTINQMSVIGVSSSGFAVFFFLLGKFFFCLCIADVRGVPTFFLFH